MADGIMIAFSGKGGSGKTTTTALVLRELLRTGRGPVLVVDADPNATLGLTLGVEPGGTISDLREEMGAAAKNPGEISKDRLMDQWLAEILREHTGFDLLTMGRPEGPKCYCYVNGLLRRYLKILRGNYAYVLVDCEAGMEYLSRLIVDEIDALVLVAEPTPVGLTTAARIAGLGASLPIRIRRRVLAVNKVRPDAAERVRQLQADVPHVQAAVHVPFDDDLARRCALGQPVDDSAAGDARGAIEELLGFCLGQPSAASAS